jgi:hypothetical protein
MEKISCTIIMALLFVIPANSQIDTAWVRIYDSPLHSYDLANTVLTDSQGNVYVCGTSSEPAWAITTIAYDSTGQTRWSRAYGCTQPIWFGSNMMAMNQNGDIYITGPEFCHTSLNFGTSRYSTQGDSIWTRLYPNSPTGYAKSRTLAVDPSGNVYVTGVRVDPENPSLWATIKYNRDGYRCWVSIFTGISGYTPGEPYDIALDDSCNVIVTGELQNSSGIVDQIATVKYDSAGTHLWAVTTSGIYYSETRMAVDHEGNIYLTGRNDRGSPRLLVVKLKPDGSLDWSHDFGSNSAGYAVAVDSNGYVYAVGTILVQDRPHTAYCIVKYDPNGVYCWDRVFDGPAGLNQVPADVAVGNSGAVYIAGHSPRNSISRDYCVVKYNSSGTLIWVARYNRTGTGYESVLDLTLDRWENVYITGGSQGASGDRFDYDFATVKFVQNSQGLTEEPIALPAQACLFDAYPNPFNSQTTIKFDLPVSSNISLSIFDIMGRKLQTLSSGILPAGSHQIIWNAIGFPSGIYFYSLKSGEYIETKKIVLLK